MHTGQLAYFNPKALADMIRPRRLEGRHDIGQGYGLCAQGTKMGTVVDWLARVGGDASLRYASAESLAKALGDHVIEDAVRAPLVARDAEALRAVMGGQGIWFSSQMPVHPDHEDDRPLDDEDDEDDDEGEGKPRRSPLVHPAPLS
ncbi:hypothetical protein [Luteibacter sp. ME-Dv--P-043b]|uniref:hypothetical protein n=1 Tax=Luteibacter sp. ME-Dv--P-043b TaxID=3040291 RepID=UPI0025527DCE|nr:hypothetical protein [Luteibacter sp. ME-Dv--P-043b]